MREIKFRAWHKPTQLMDDAVLIDFYNEKIGILYADPVMQCESIQKYNFNEVELMQYTGLKDKNGEEIYEGDIITTNLERPYLIVEYRNGAFMLNCNDGLEDYYDIFFGTSEEPKEVYKYGEVIGNIYENPELMTLTND